MHVITKKRLKEAREKFPDATKELEGWLRIAKFAAWKNFMELRQTFIDADAVDEYVVFNIRRNRHRLITIVRYPKVDSGRTTRGRIYIKSFLTHRQ